MADTPSLTKKLKWAGWALKFAKQMPKVALFGFISAIGYFGHQYIETARERNQLILSQIQELSNQNKQLMAQNKSLTDANQAITADMRAIKIGIEKYSRTLAEIRVTTQSLERDFRSEKFRELLKKDLPKAEKEFNGFFNDYFLDIQKDTTKYAK